MKVIGTYQLAQIKFDTFELPPEWAMTFGRPEKNFQMIVYGDSGDGKTDFDVQFAKMMANVKGWRGKGSEKKYGYVNKVLYVTFEEGISSTIQEAFGRHNLSEDAGRVLLAEKGNFAAIVEYLSGRNKPNIVIIDSLDYMKLTADQYKKLVEMFPKTAFIIISWSRGDVPKTQAGKDIEYMCDIKVRVKKYIAYPRCRYGGNIPFIIWDKGARDNNPAALYEMVRNKISAEKVKEVFHIGTENGEPEEGEVQTELFS